MSTKTLRVWSPDGKYLDVPIDDVTGYANVLGSVQSLNYNQNAVYNGSLFLIQYGASVADDGVVEFEITVGAKALDAAINVYGAGAMAISLFSGPTLHAPLGGSAITPINMNQNSAKTLLTTVKQGCTIDADGTAIISGLLTPGGNPAGMRLGSIALESSVFVLKPSTVYLLRVQNKSGGAVVVGAAIECSEEA